MTDDNKADDKDEGSYSQGQWVPPKFDWQPVSEEESRLIRARQRSRNRALAVVLVALVVLFFAITIVKMKIKGHL